jgi:hypothetical protein
MKELINNELLQLQKELESLKSASQMISEAGRASGSVIEEAKNIHREFSDNMSKLTELYQKYIDQLNTLTGEKQAEMLRLVKDSVSEQSKIADGLISKQSSLIESNAEQAAQKIELVKNTYLNQTAKTDRLLNSYLELAQSTTELKDKISSVDFPARLDRLGKQFEQLTEQQKKSNDEYEKLGKTISENQALKQSQKNYKMMSSIKGLLWIVIIWLAMLTGAAAYLYLKFK